MYGPLRPSLSLCSWCLIEQTVHAPHLSLQALFLPLCFSFFLFLLSLLLISRLLLLLAFGIFLLLLFFLLGSQFSSDLQENRVFFPFNKTACLAAINKAVMERTFWGSFGVMLLLLLAPCGAWRESCLIWCLLCKYHSWSPVLYAGEVWEPASCISAIITTWE